MRISSGRKKKLYKCFLSAVFFLFLKRGKATLTCCMQSTHICLINVQLHTIFFFLQKALNCQVPGELFTADLLMAQGVQTMTSIISILKYTQAYRHLHKITEETRANANTVARMRIYSAGLHTRGLGGKIFIFGPSLATLVTALIHLLRCADLSKTEGKISSSGF